MIGTEFQPRFFQVDCVTYNEDLHVSCRSVFFVIFESKVPLPMAKQVVYSSQAPEPIGPYSQAIQAGNMLFLSGQIAINRSNGQLVTGTIQEEAHQVMKNLSEVLKAGGMDFSHVVKSTIFMKDLSQFSFVNEVYGSYFQKEPPARETVEVSRLPRDVNVEISCIAVK